MTTVRRGSLEDLERLIELSRRYCEADFHDFDATRARAGFVPLLVDDEFGAVWMICNEDPVGYAVVTWGWSIESGGRDALLDEMYVDDPGAGSGALALSHIIEDCRRRGLPRIFLETESHNEGARRLYRRYGFQAENSIWMTLDLGE